MTHRLSLDVWLDLGTARLHTGQGVTTLTPKTFALLRHLITHPQQILSTPELLKAVWPNRYVNDTEVRHYIRQLRQALGDDHRAPRYIETVHGRGYRFISHVATMAGPTSADRESRPPTLPPMAKPEGTFDRTIGRQAELEYLHHLLTQALAGQRQVVFISGEPGIGKTTLITAFMQTLAAQGEVWRASGQCVEAYGRDEAYMPVLAAIEDLCRGSAATAVLACLKHHAPNWLLQLPGLVTPEEQDALQRYRQGSTQARMLHELAQALEMLAAEQGLVLCLEDLQWADVSTIALIDYLARRPQTARLLVLGTLRSLAGLERQNPLIHLHTELRLHQYCQELALTAFSEGLVGEYLQARFGEVPTPWVHSIYRHTDGNPLFVVSVVADLLAQNIIAWREGRWMIDGNPDTIQWGIPETLRALILQQFERLASDPQRLLAAASVAGGEFAATLLAETLGWDIETVEEQCAALVRHHRFLAPAGQETWPDGTLSARYAFGHTLYRQTLYEQVTPNRRQRLHQAIGERLERGHLGHTGEIAAQLAMHFESSGDIRRAVHYHRQAGETAFGRHALSETITHLQRGLALLPQWTEEAERLEEELRLQISLGAVMIVTEGFGTSAVARTYRRAHALCRQLANKPTLLPTLCGLWNYFLTRADFRRVRVLARQLSTLLCQPGSPECLLPAYNALGQTHFYIGEADRALRYLEAGLGNYDIKSHRHLASLYGEDPAVVYYMYAAQTRWLLGYPEQAIQLTETGLRQAEELAQPFGIAQMLWTRMHLAQGRRDVAGIETQALALHDFCQQENIVYWRSGGHILRGWALAIQGQPAAGIALIRQGLQDWDATGTALFRPYYLALLAEAQGNSGQLRDALEVVAEALATVRRTGERWYEAELYRIQAELRLQQGKSETVEIEAGLHQALAIAHHQQAIAMELRTANSLAHLWAKQGKRREAYELLGTVYNRFTEGFAAADLKKAKALLDELGH